MAIVDAIVAEFAQEAQATRRILERVPEDQLSWKPHPKSYSLGQLALHIAVIPAAITGAVSQDIFEFPKMTVPEAKSRAEILGASEQSEAAANEAFKRIDDARATATWTVTTGGKTVFAVPRIGALRTILLNHWYHHRGQLAVYLRLLDVPVPSIYGPSADENPFG